MRRPLVALTGATGFLGRHIAQALAAKGLRLRLLVRNPSTIAPLSGDSIELVAGDLDDVRALQTLARDADIVVHAAGLIKARRDRDYFSTNVDGSARLAHAVRKHASGARLILVSSLAARAPHLSAYAASKRASEDAAIAAAGDVPVTVLRPCAVYGPGDRETLRLFETARRPALVIPREPARISLIHVSDIAEAVVAVARIQETRGLYEVTDSRCDGYTWDEIIATAVAALNTTPRLFRVPIRALHAAVPLLHLARWARPNSMLSPGKLREILHGDWSSSSTAQLPRALWSPRVGLAHGFRQTVDWYHEHGWLPAACADAVCPQRLGHHQC